ncbi:hypothetical protein C5167_017565 [Papaver somniferum]|uniref:Uncharacterized protein n=1 Tax=Papaver somniferum TaxID=3469 RepID=A0A4Y7INT0_PAPSO|nr:hypothetical protein C5167_017565 [Papaver somniferum]
MGFVRLMSNMSRCMLGKIKKVSWQLIQPRTLVTAMQSVFGKIFLSLSKQRRRDVCIQVFAPLVNVVSIIGYWKFVTPATRNFSDTGTIFYESQGGCWRLIDTEEELEERMWVTMLVCLHNARKKMKILLAL